MICLDFIQFIVTLSHLVHCKLLFLRIILAFEHFSINFITIFCSSSVFFKYSSISHTQDFLISRASSFWTFKFIMFLFLSPWTGCRTPPHSGGSPAGKCRCSEELSRSERWSVWKLKRTHSLGINNKPGLWAEQTGWWRRGDLVDVVVSGVVEVVAERRGQHDQYVDSW